MSDQGDLFGEVPPEKSFGGKTYDPALDFRRLMTSLKAIHSVMLDGRRHTLPELATVGRCSETAASARVRDLRKKEFGSYVVESARDPIIPGLWHYWIVLDGEGKPIKAPH